MRRLSLRATHNHRRATTLVELLLTFLLLSILLTITASLLQSFLRARSKGAQQDEQLRVVQQVQSTLCTELRGGINVTLASNNVTMSHLDASAVHLPVPYPSPAPAQTPYWDPNQSLMTVKYYLDPTTAQLVRESTPAGGAASKQVIAEGIASFTIQEAQPRLYVINLQTTQAGEGQTLQFKTYRITR